MSADRHLFCFGFGYSAEALSADLLADGWRVTGTTRDASKADAMRARGIGALCLPGDALGEVLRSASHILISAAPTEVGDPALAHVRDALRSREGDPDWCGYLSTTGVYGDHQGGWVDETTPLAPTTRRGRWRAEAETAWRDYARAEGLALHIFRLAGIYGPGRGPFEKVKAGTARRIIKDGQVFSRIHVADIAQVLRLSMARPRPGAVYNLCDDEPAPPQDVLSHAAELIGRPPPPTVAWEDAEMGPMARSFYGESKRVSNAHVKRELGVSLLYPDYRSGLAAILRTERR